jgi:hypothetical protein
MSQDLFLKKTNRNYARGDSPRAAKPNPFLLSAPSKPNPFLLSAPSKPNPFILPGQSKPNPFILPGQSKPNPFLGAFIGDEERELARHGGSSERGALRRRTRSLLTHTHGIF